LGGGYGDGFGGLSLAIGNLGNIVAGFGAQLQLWADMSFGRIIALIEDFNDTAPEEIPGLPLCMSAPMDHDICAIYYIMQHTFFRDGTPGRFILPLGMIVLGLILVVLTVRYALYLIRRGMEAVQSL